jgi:pectinesterase
MARYQSLISMTLLCIILVIINFSTQVMCHTKGLRPGRHIPANPFSENSTQTQLIERRFTKWVQFMGSLDHSIFKQALNKVFPSYTITVDKNPSAGDFTSIQAAVDSLPLINLVRVVIKVNAGIYT